ncbi:MAG: c-type cytochrome domain-containing protein [Planctomycetota bacterium]|nr:c-type cytochrome domain-containing protein [Planctomycetota bacterium]
MSSTLRTQMILAIVLLGFACGPAQSADERKSIADGNPKIISGEHLFTLKVLPILKEKCQGCHGADPDDLKGDFSVLSREALLRGGETGDPSIFIVKPEERYLVCAIKW